LQPVNSPGNNCPPVISAAVAAVGTAYFQGFFALTVWHDHRKARFGLNGMAAAP